MFNVKLFVDWLLINNNIDIQSLNVRICTEDINNILDEIKLRQREQFQLEQTIENVITKTSNCLPYITLEFCSIYTFNKKLLFNILLKIYRKNIYKKNNFYIFESFIFVLLPYKYQSLYNGLITVKDQEEYCRKYNIKQEYSIINKKFFVDKVINIKDIEKIIIYTAYEYLRIKAVYKSMNIIIILLLLLFTRNSNNFSIKKKRKYCNLIIKILLYNFYVLKDIACASDEYAIMLIEIQRKQLEPLIFDKYKKKYKKIKHKYKKCIHKMLQMW